MITLITGTPGTGKTAYVVSELEKVTGRNIYVDGIPDLVLPHEPSPPVQEWVKVNHDESGATSHEWLLPPNSIIIIDEAQRSFRPRPTGSKVPDYVAALETHRHAGLDFWFITQHPGLLDVNIRRLCGRHIHVRNTPIGRRLHESTQVFDPENKSERDATVTRPYKLPAHVFGKYKSAEMHTKTGKRLPLSFYFMLAALVAFAILGFTGYQSIKAKTQPKNDPVATVDKHAAVSNGQQNSGPSKDPSEMAIELIPRVPGRPETAPAYDGLRVARNMPVVVGCLQSANRCTCLNQQGLDAGLDNMQCKQWLEKPPFDSYREPPPVLQGSDKDSGATQARPAGPASPDPSSPLPESPRESV
jgi:zona occludens toxin